jgi:glycosyltransferase involved in cell wall biosynthesis
MAGGKRVLMVAPTPYFSDRGCHVQIYEVARSQQLNGNDVQIVTYHLGRDMAGIPTHRTPTVPWYTKREAGPSVHKFYLDALLMAKVLQVARSYRPHIIHAHLHEGAAAALPVARLLGIPLVLDLQGSLSGELVNHGFVRDGSVPHRLMRAIETQIHDRVDALLMWTYIRDAMESMFAFDQSKVFHAHYGVDLEAFRPHARHTLQDLYASLGLPTDRKIVVFLGILSEYQGIDLLLESIPRVLQQRQDTHFLLMGYPNEAKYRALADRLGFAQHVTLPGKIDYLQAARYLSLGDVAVSPKLTRMEGNGKLLNYLACGLPTVAFDLPGNRMALQDAGVFVPTGDREQLAEALIDLLSNDTRRAELARRSRMLAEQQYAWKVIGATIDRMYTHVLERAYAPRATSLAGRG